MSKISDCLKTERYINKKSYKFKKAFTMLELVVVIVVVGILALAALPRLDRDQLGSAVDDIMAAVRRTQLLAMEDNQFDPANQTNPTWHTRRWRISLSSNSYVISQSRTGREIEGVLDKKYGVTYADIDCPVINPGDPTPHHIGFDEYGRILEANGIIRGYGYDGINSALYQSPCVIKVETKHRKATITVAPVTGAMTVSYQDI